MKKGIALYGVGKHLEEQIEDINIKIEDIDIFVDSDEKKQKTEFKGRTILSPEAINDEIDTVVVGSDKYFKEISEEVKNNYPQITEIILVDDFKYQNKSKTLLQEKKICDREFIVRKTIDAKPIKAELLDDCKVLSNREEALSFIPKGCVATEIGVAYGDFSKKILDNVRPKLFIAIDTFNVYNPYAPIWNKGDLSEEFYNLNNEYSRLFKRNHFEETNKSHREWYEARFKEFIEKKEMKIEQGFSWERLASYPDNFFDFIYLDAGHDYESVAKDISVIRKKIKNGGIIQFNDYTNYDILDGSVYGVQAAVNEYINTTQSQVLFLCLDCLGFNDIVVRAKK